MDLPPLSLVAKNRGKRVRKLEAVGWAVQSTVTVYTCTTEQDTPMPLCSVQQSVIQSTLPYGRGRFCTRAGKLPLNSIGADSQAQHMEQIYQSSVLFRSVSESSNYPTPLTLATDP